MPAAGYDRTFPYLLPTYRVKEILFAHIQRAFGMTRADIEYRLAHPQANNEYGVYQIENLTGILARRIYGILREEHATIKFDTVDKILCGLGLVDLWHQPPEVGGLADFYECKDPEQMPALPVPTAKQMAVRKKTNAQRNERNKAYREANREKVRQQNREAQKRYRQKNLERVRAKDRARKAAA